MKKNIFKTMAVCAAFIIPASNSYAKNNFTVNAKADFVSSYIWRGMDQKSGFAVQPALNLSWNGITLGAWGSQSLSKWEGSGSQEFDINLSYNIKGLTLMVSDLWWGGMDCKYGWYEQPDDASQVDYRHHFEGTIAYNFNETCNLPLTLSWSTWFAGADTKFAGGSRSYSTYINAAYDFSLPQDITLSASIGATPWKGYYYKNGGITDISLKAAKSLQVTDNFAIPVFVQAIASPIQDKAFLVGGFSLGF